VEGALAQPVGREPGVAEHWSGRVPGLAEVHFYGRTEKALHEVPEVGDVGLGGEVVAFALDDAPRETRRRLGCRLGREEPHVPDEQAADDRIVTGADRCPPVVGDAGAHFLDAADAVGLAEQLLGLGDQHRRRVAE
jgi:hypothetical protein